MSGENIWLDWAVKLQSIAQAGLTYGKDKFDIERYEEIRKISAEIVAYKTEIPLEKVIAVQDREKHNKPVYAWKICKISHTRSAKRDESLGNAIGGVNLGILPLKYKSSHSFVCVKMGKSARFAHLDLPKYESLRESKCNLLESTPILCRLTLVSKYSPVRFTPSL